MLVMGVYSTYWFQAINQGVAPLVTHAVDTNTVANAEVR